jgi:hypothetical protein
VIAAIVVIWVFLCAIAASGWVIYRLQQRLETLTDEYRLTRIELLAAKARVKETESQATNLVTAVTPLIVKTDWMTGRWHGQFQTLVQLENARNEDVVRARQALWKIPVVMDTALSSMGLDPVPAEHPVGPWNPPTADTNDTTTEELR